jgi:hypothetical protein
MRSASLVARSPSTPKVGESSRAGTLRLRLPHLTLRRLRPFTPHGTIALTEWGRETGARC